MQTRWLFVAVIACGLGQAAAAHAQAANYEPFRIDSGLTGTYVPSSHRGGFGGMFEAKFVATDQLAIGARVEGDVMFGGNIDAGGAVAMSIGAVAATLIKGEYYFLDGGARPFAGLSAGMYDIVSQSIAAGNMGMASVDQKAGRYFGVAPQLGVDLGRMRLAVAYNAILGASIEVHQTVGGAQQTTSFSQNYFTFEMSFRFGGRRLVKQ